jgi:hypothetical protein
MALDKMIRVSEEEKNLLLMLRGFGPKEKSFIRIFLEHQITEQAKNNEFLKNAGISDSIGADILSVLKSFNHALNNL